VLIIHTTFFFFSYSAIPITKKYGIAAKTGFTFLKTRISITGTWLGCKVVPNRAEEGNVGFLIEVHLSVP
jgi:hypothetical protein